MKHILKHYKLIIFIVVIILIYFIYELNNNQNKNYLALGDGFAIGQNSYGIIDYGYSDFLKDKLQDENKLKLYTKKFSSSEMMITNLYEAIVTNKEVVEKNKVINLKHSLREASIVTLSIGLNDIIYKLSLENNHITNAKINKIISTTEEDFNTLIKEIKKYYPNKIYVIGYYRLKNSNYTINSIIDELNNFYRNNNKITYIDISKIFEENKNYLSNPNSIYPNIDGYKAIYKEIIKKLEK